MGHPVIWIEWLLSTLFDASLLTPEPPIGGSFFLVMPSAGCAFADSTGGRVDCPQTVHIEGDFLTLACEGGVR